MASDGATRSDPREAGFPLSASLHQELARAGVDRLADFAAAIDSANYWAERMTNAARYADRFALLAAACERRPADGLVLEFGVASGTTLNLIASCIGGEPAFGFDSFEGLPEDWRPGFPRGMFGTAPPDKLPPNASLVIGMFDDTLPAFLAREQGPISLLHVDCDLYASTCSVLRHCAPRLREGSVIVFDEYFNYPGWRAHEFRAFQEFVAETGLGYEYVGVVPTDQQAAVVVTRRPGAASDG